MKKIYSCAHCDRKGHLVKFCYAKLNMTNKNVYVQENTNPIGPKKIWVPKDTPNLIDKVRHPPPKLRGRWCPGGGCIKP